jgi:hypothetical protein
MGALGAFRVVGFIALATLERADFHSVVQTCLREQNAPGMIKPHLS